MSGHMRTGGSTTRSDTSAGPRVATWAASWTSWLAADSPWKDLITHQFPIDQAPQAYQLHRGEMWRPYLGVPGGTYPSSSRPAPRARERPRGPSPTRGHQVSVLSVAGQLRPLDTAPELEGQPGSIVWWQSRLGEERRPNSWPQAPALSGSLDNANDVIDDPEGRRGVIVRQPPRHPCRSRRRSAGGREERLLRKSRSP